MPVGAVLVHPEVGMWMNDFAFGDLEKLRRRDVEKSKVGEVWMLAEVVLFDRSGLGAADQKGATVEAG